MDLLVSCVEKVPVNLCALSLVGTDAKVEKALCSSSQPVLAKPFLLLAAVLSSPKHPREAWPFLATKAAKVSEGTSFHFLE